MSIFDRIKHAIFGEAHAASVPQPSTGGTTDTSPAPQVRPASSAPAPAATAGNTSASAEQMASPAPSQERSPQQADTTPRPSVDIEPILDAAVQKSGHKLDWRHSIVDLMKALGMDASLEERKELAHELGYSGDAHDSAKMNMFLHKALMKKLAENGGKVPADLLD
ncbi:DUF3597 domain-containing protein [Rhizobium sp. 2MFCol3.1]|uniref:DUF3597 domain-containing protein n=1 Tax=Rhizobium sp. 2MFCol3.1 TaxID=1246459 RepID=UPI0003826852|nr:DUF3597 domain-containing protein [Rhizobium sp. 2MFCol3.1]